MAFFKKSLAFVFFCALFALAQVPGVAHLAAPHAVTARAHSTVVADLHITIDPGFHIQSNHPKLDYLIASHIAIAPAGGIAVAHVAWPVAKPHTFTFAPNQPLNVFEGNVSVPVTLKTTAPGSVTLHGTFRYQACNDTLCRPPVTVPFTLPVHVH